MKFTPIPPERKLTRKKTGVDPYYKTPTYGLYTPDNVLVAEVSQTGQPGRDNYPWGWILVDGIKSTHPRGTTQGSATTLTEAIDVISYLYEIPASEMTLAIDSVSEYQAQVIAATMTEYILNPTVEGVREAWLKQFTYAGPSEKFDAEQAIDALLAPLKEGK